MSLVLALALGLCFLAITAALPRPLNFGERSGLALTLTLSLVGLAGISLGLQGAFGGGWLSLVLLGIAGPLLGRLGKRGTREQLAPLLTRPRLASSWKSWSAGLLIVLVGLALRSPPIPGALAGRDQGTYSLRAEHLVRTGGFDMHDPLIATAWEEDDADLLALYDRPGQEWREGVYESAYRPGAYLANYEQGRVVPQFLHLHPTVLAVGGLVLGVPLMEWTMSLWSLAALLALLALGRLWGWHRAAALFPAAALALTPLAVWTQRTPLSEGPSLALGLASIWAWELGRIRLEGRERQILWLLAAVLLGTSAWVRGNAFLMLPLWALCGFVSLADSQARRAIGLLLLVSASSVAVHALSVYPYLHDELLRRAEFLGHPPPGKIVAAAALGTVGWSGFAWLATRERELREAMAKLGAAVLGLSIGAALIALGGWLLHRGIEAPTKPFARLDAAPALFHWIGCAFGLLAALAAGEQTLRRLFPPRREAREGFEWMAQRALPLVLMCGVWGLVSWFSRRGLPQLGLYYYGRYLVPELLPGAFLAIGWVLARLPTLAPRASLEPLFERGSQVLSLVLALALAWPLAFRAQTLIVEFAHARVAMKWLSQQIPEEAALIAGGEGWHHGHTYNQVAGVLHLGRQQPVLPYRSREAAYASAHALLEQPVPTFLVLNEASHHYRREDGRLIAGLDDGLHAPFRAGSVRALEFFVHRLTPVTDRVPDRVTRDSLRLAAIELQRDPNWSSDGRIFRPAGSGLLRNEAGEALIAQGASLLPGSSSLCLRSGAPLRIVLDPKKVQASLGALALVFESPGLEPSRARIKLDSQSLVTRAAKSLNTPRQTLGPLLVTPLDSPRQLEVRVSAAPSARERCAAKLRELRWLPPEHSALSQLAESDWIAWSTGPQDDRGEAFEAVRWVSARSLSRYRPFEGGAGAPEIQALSIRLDAKHPRVRFQAISLPGDEETEFIDLVLTLTKAKLPKDAVVVLSSSKGELHRFELPEDRSGSWQSSSLRVPRRELADHPQAARFQLELRRVSGKLSKSALIDLRDLALFAVEEGRSAPSLPPDPPRLPRP